MIFIGGSIVNHGGQNPIEPARYGLSIVHGPNVRNFKDIFKFFKEKKLAFKINNQNSIKESKTPNSSLKETIMDKNPIRKKQNQKPKKFVSNGTLNDLLNETAQGDTNLLGGSSSPVSLSEPFASGDPMPMETAGLPPSVADAVTRDYSGLMEAIDKKKGK